MDSAASNKATKARAGDLELGKPPAKMLKKTPENTVIASLPPPEGATPSSQSLPNTSQPHFLTEVRQQMENEKATPTSSSRLYVNEVLVRGFELHTASLTITELLKTDDVKSNPCLVDHFVESINKLRKESQDFLETPENLFVTWELRLLELIKYMIRTGESSVTSVAGEVTMNKWMHKQRKRKTDFENGDKYGLGTANVKRLQEDIALLNRIVFAWKGGETKTFDDYFAELSTAYKEEHGNVKIPRRMPDSNLGEWVHRMRKEYDDFQREERCVR